MLRCAVSCHRSATQLGSHQAEWREQQNRLHLQRQRAEEDLHSAVTALALNSYDADFDSSAVDIHSLHREIQQSLEEWKVQDKGREEWAQFVRGPRMKAHKLIEDVRRLKQGGEKETRLRKQQREDELQSTGALLKSLMRGLRHQSAAFAEQLYEEEKGLQEELKHCTPQWLERMEDDGQSLSTAVVDEGMEAALPVNPHWMAVLSSDQRAEVEVDRQRWFAVLVERLDMAERRHFHRLKQLQVDFREAVASITVERRVGWAEDEGDGEKNGNDDKGNVDSVKPGKRTDAGVSGKAISRRSGASSAVVSKLKVKGQRMSSPSEWSTSDERRLRWLYREYTTAGKSRKQLLNRLVEVEFAAFPLDELKQRLDLLVHHKFNAEQRNIELSQLKQNKEVITQAVLTDWTTAVDALKVEWKRREEQQRRDVELAEKRTELEEQRLMKEQREQLMAAEAEVGRAAVAEAEAVRAGEEKKRREEEQRRLRDYEAAQALGSEKVQRLIEAEQRRLEVEKEEESHYHSQRVALRHQQSLAKFSLQRQAEEEQRAERQKREANLQALAESLAPVVAASTARLMAPTASSAAVEEGSTSLFSVDGYTNEEVFDDPRAKLSAALYVAGIAPAHEYAREVLERAGANGKQMRKDLRSSFTFRAEVEGQRGRET